MITYEICDYQTSAHIGWVRMDPNLASSIDTRALGIYLVEKHGPAFRGAPKVHTEIEFLGLLR